MEKVNYDEKNGLWYELQGDYYIPYLKLPEEEQQTEYDDTVIRIINEQAQAFIDDLFGKLGERMIDLCSGKTVLVGGGSILLKK